METNAILTKASAGSQNKEVKIVVIDDDPMYLQKLENELMKNPNYKTYSFKTGEDSFKHIPIINPDIIILDYRLSDLNPETMNGVEILKRLKVIKPDVFVLMLSGKESLEVAANCTKYGAFDYIIKNETAIVRLKNVIRKVLDHVGLQKALKERRKYSILLIVTGMAMVISPVVLKYNISENVPWLIIGLFIGYFILFGIVNKTKFSNYTKGQIREPLSS